MEQILEYSIFYRHESEAGMIHMHMADGSNQHFPFHSIEEASLLIDILRNEKPVYYNAEDEIIY